MDSSKPTTKPRRLPRFPRRKRPPEDSPDAAGAAPSAPVDDVGAGDSTITQPRLVADNTGLVATGLSKTIKRLEIVRDVDISIGRGEIVGLLGPNGAGKTTTFYLLTGLIPANRGTIVLDGIDVTDLPLYRRARMGLGYLPQESSVFRGLSVEENLLALLEVTEPDREARQTIADELLEEFGISRVRHAAAIALSGGERRRVEIARALTTRPNILLLDEPLTGIDPIAIGELKDLILQLRDRGIGVLVTDHNVREMLTMVDRAYIIHNGAVLAAGVPGDIVSNEDVRRVFLGHRFRL
ncbi:MAG: LPS export ABC transporter ATP-binding protein [Alphaproteobacteria bacterium]|nr:LPS export ABC transporter ATP-binding protein [Alphaproteobacteria bacterium]